MKAVTLWSAAVLTAAMMTSCRGKPSDPPVRCYAGAGLQKALDASAAEYRKQTGREVQIDYGGSGMVMSRVRLDKKADLFVPGDAWYLDQLGGEGLIESRTSVARLAPVILVTKGNPRNITSLADLSRLARQGRLKLALGDERACQIGRVSRQLFEKAGLQAPEAMLHSTTVNELAVWVVTGRAEAAIVWDAVAAGVTDSAESVTIPTSENILSHVAVGLMKGSSNKQAARRFVDFLTSPPGREVLRANGYTAAEGP